MLPISPTRSESSFRAIFAAHRSDPVAVLADGRTRADGRPEQSFCQLCGREAALCDRSLSQRGEPALRRAQSPAADRRSSPATTRLRTWRAIPGSSCTSARARTSTTSRTSNAGSRRIKARPAVVRAYDKAKAVNPNAGGIRTPEERAILFGRPRPQSTRQPRKRGSAARCTSAYVSRLSLRPAGTRFVNSPHAKCGIFGRSPRALPLIGGRGSLAGPASMTKLCASEYHGPFTSGVGAGSFSCRT